MNFDGDAFISYDPLDNVALREGGKGWIANLHHVLEARVGMLLGKKAAIFLDPRLNTSDPHENINLERLRRVGALVSVVSPAYVKSDSAKRKLVEFWKAAESQGGVRLRDKDRVFKVVKTPVQRERELRELQSLLPYEFFKLDPQTGKVRELNPEFGTDAEREFLIRLDDLAHDICSVLEILEDTSTGVEPVTVAGKTAVFLAETTSDLQEQRDAVRRDLTEHGYTVLPTRTLPLIGPAMGAFVREDLARCRMSIHMVGKSYGLVPEGSAKSLFEIQNELAIERGEKGGFSRLLWIPKGLRVEDSRQRLVLEQIRMDSRMRDESDLLELPLEDLRTEVLKRLKRTKEQTPPPAGSLARLYLMYDPRDAENITPWVDFLFEQGLEVIHPMLEGDEADIREFHDENLRTCDGALIFYGAANEYWLLRKLAEVKKSPGNGRIHPLPAVAIVQIPPKTPSKQRLKTHEAEIIPQWEGLSPDAFESFVSACIERHPASPISIDLELTRQPIGVNTNLGPYELVAPLGSGGMGKVYRACDHRLDCEVAIKVLKEGLLTDEEARHRFRDEAKALAKLRDIEQIAVIYDVGEKDGIDYLVMEFVQGGTLAEKLKSGPLKESEVVLIGAQIAEALEGAHELGVVHRDLKPANIMVTTKGRVKVLDFGLAKFMASTGSFLETHSFAGTPVYMAPEQLKGEQVDVRTDLYALGNVLYEMAAGSRPFQDQEKLMARLMNAIKIQPPIHLQMVKPELSAELDRIVAKALEKDRELRYQNAGEMRADLTKLARRVADAKAMEKS